MASRAALICEVYRHSEQKPARKFCGSKEDKNSETHPEKPEKGETGCVLGAGESSSGWRRMKPGEKTQDRLEKGGNSSIAWRKWRGELVSPAGSGAAPRWGASSTDRGGSRDRFAAERHWRSLTPRHALRRAQPCLVAESLCALTKNREASIVLASLFLAGAEGLGLRSAPVGS